MLSFERKKWNPSKYWNLMKMNEFYHNVEIWVQNVKLMKMVLFESKLLEVQCKMSMSKYCNSSIKIGINQNVEVWTQRYQMLKLSEMVKIREMLKFEL